MTCECVGTLPKYPKIGPDTWRPRYETLTVLADTQARPGVRVPRRLGLRLVREVDCEGLLEREESPRLLELPRHARPRQRDPRLFEYPNHGE